MKTEISRPGFRPARRYSGVFQQQGRVLSDADWNELVDILRAALTSSLGDVVAEGAPRAGGAVAPDGTIRWGRVYADGVPAELRPVAGQEASTNVFGHQADFPGAPAAPAGSVAYLDVWDRSVTALEDAGLLDPALHGADTTTRSQTMAQLKWCPAGTPPACDDPARNPQIGDALLAATPRTGTSELDPCDPCAGEVSADVAAIGNYLFRVEVHDVKGPANAPTEVVLKWSSENGAQAHPKDRLPAGFGAGGWVYELYNDRAEKHLGVHLSGTPPTRGQLATSLPATIAAEWTDVRRWDGYCTLAFAAGAWSLSAGSDRGVTLTSVTPLDTAHASFTIDPTTSRLTVNLRGLQVELVLGGKRFVAGDHWLALVRERDTAAPVTVASATPSGIRHHYLTLGTLAGGKVTLDHETRRRFAFPPLTDIEARDVEYTTACANGLFTGVKTVQDALAALCNLGANHVAYDDVCANGLFTGVTTVEGALQALCDLRASHVGFDKACENGLFTGVATVEGALQALCNLGANHVAFDKACANGLFTGVTTVEGALQALCDLGANHVSYTGPEDCELDAADDTVAAALDALCRREVPEGELCDYILRLFGWGVLCGLVPEIADVHDAGRFWEPLGFAIRATEGRFLSSRGCMVEASDMGVEGRFFQPGGGWTLDERFDLQEFGDRIGAELLALRAGDRELLVVDTLESRQRRMITDKRVGDLVGRLKQGGVSALELESIVEDVTKIRDASVVEEISAVINANAGGRTARPEEEEQSQWLYVVDDDDGPRLELRLEPPKGAVALTRAVRNALENPEQAGAEDAWQPFREITCPEPSDGAVCLGKVSRKGDEVSISPEDREQMFPTPAYQARHWMTRYRAV